MQFAAWYWFPALGVGACGLQVVLNPILWQTVFSFVPQQGMLLCIGGDK